MQHGPVVILAPNHSVPTIKLKHSNQQPCTAPALLICQRQLSPLGRSIAMFGLHGDVYETGPRSAQLNATSLRGTRSAGAPLYKVARSAPNFTLASPQLRSTCLERQAVQVYCRLERSDHRRGSEPAFEFSRGIPKEDCIISKRALTQAMPSERRSIFWPLSPYLLHSATPAYYQGAYAAKSALGYFGLLSFILYLVKLAF